MTGGRQIPFDLSPGQSFDFSNFILGEANAAAYKIVSAWPDWPSKILCLIGPAGSGKTHLGHAWLTETGGIPAQTGSEFPGSWRGKTVLIDDAESRDETILFTALNMALNGDVAGLMLTSHLIPAQWKVVLPDLRSRLVNAPVIDLKDPGDDLLESIIRQLFEAKGRIISKDLIDYLLKYQDRSIGNLRAVVDKLDLAASEMKSDLTKRFAAAQLK